MQDITTSWLSEGLDYWIGKKERWKAFSGANFNLYESLEPQLESFYRQVCAIESKEHFINAVYENLYRVDIVNESEKAKILLQLVARLKFSSAIPLVDEKINYLLDCEKTEFTNTILERALNAFISFVPHQDTHQKLEKYFRDIRTPESAMPMLFSALCKVNNSKWVEYFEIFNFSFCDPKIRQLYLREYIFAKNFLKIIGAEILIDGMQKINFRKEQDARWFLELFFDNDNKMLSISMQNFNFSELIVEYSEDNGYSKVIRFTERKKEIFDFLIDIYNKNTLTSNDNKNTAGSQPSKIFKELSRMVI